MDVLESQLTAGQDLPGALGGDHHLPQLLGAPLVQGRGLHGRPALGEGAEEVGGVLDAHHVRAVLACRQAGACGGGGLDDGREGAAEDRPQVGVVLRTEVVVSQDPGGRGRIDDEAEGGVEGAGVGRDLYP